MDRSHTIEARNLSSNLQELEFLLGRGGGMVFRPRESLVSPG